MFLIVDSLYVTLVTGVRLYSIRCPKNTLNNDTSRFSFDACPQCNKDSMISPIPLQRNESYTFLITNGFLFNIEKMT